MQITSLAAIAAFALTATAQEPAVAKGGALDFAKRFGQVGARGVPEANQGARGAVAFGGATDFFKHNKQNKRDEPSAGGAWAVVVGGAGIAQEVPIPASTPSPVAKVESAPNPSDSVGSTLQKSDSDHPITDSAPRPSEPARASVIPATASHASSASSQPKAGSTAEQGSHTTRPPQSGGGSNPPATEHWSFATDGPPEPPASLEPVAPPGPTSIGDITFKIVNSMGGSISISYEVNTYAPAAGKPTVAPSLIGPSSTEGVFVEATTVVAPLGWAGRMIIGKGSGPLDYRGTKIEGNNGWDGGDPNALSTPDIDVSYVDGYSVPTVCSCGNVVYSGCNVELWDTGIKCDRVRGKDDHKVCINDPNRNGGYGPASPFFQPCAHAAYTFPYDDAFSNAQLNCPGNTFTCCIGTKCPRKLSQPAAQSKRELMARMNAHKRADAAIAAAAAAAAAAE